jgi:hypothetical protein
MSVVPPRKISATTFFFCFVLMALKPYAKNVSFWLIFYDSFFFPNLWFPLFYSRWLKVSNFQIFGREFLRFSGLGFRWIIFPESQIGNQKTKNVKS